MNETNQFGIFFLRVLILFKTQSDLGKQTERIDTKVDQVMIRTSLKWIS